MKKLVVFIVLSLVLLPAGRAQVRPFVEEGKIWSLLQIGLNYTYVIRGDTLIGGKSYKKVYQTWKKDLEGLGFFWGMREENGRVYMRSSEKYDEKFFFDFNVKQGDEMILDRSVYGEAPGYDVTVIGKVEALRDTLLFDGISRKAWDVKVRIEGVFLETGEVPAPVELGTFTMIEEIGVKDRGLEFYSFNYDVTGLISEILCVHDGQGNVILNAGKGCSVGKHDPDGIGRVPKKTEAPGEPLYDLSGRRLKGIPATGLYIQGGKKWMKR